jgi:hypothetical protein
MMKDYTIRSIRVDPKEWEAAQASAAKRRISMSELIRQLLEAYNVDELKQ